MTGFFELRSQLQLLFKAQKLNVPGIVVVVVQANFTDGDHLGMLAELGVEIQIGGGHGLAVLGVAAHGSVNVVVFLRQLDGRYRRCPVAATVDYQRNAGFRQLCAQQLLAVGVEALVIVVGVRVKVHGRLSLPLL